MMEKYKTDDTFLARWISGDLSEAELKAFKKTEAYKQFNKINDGSQQFITPSYNKEKAFSNLKASLKPSEQKGKVVKLIPNWAYSVAAILVVAIGVYFFTNNNIASFKTGIGEQLAVTLPDNSKVILNANSSLKYNSSNWNTNRALNLKGEAFFDVEKGSTFTVNSSQGQVKVLGTEFNVISRTHFFEVKCFEGKVEVSNTKKEKLATLTQGMAFRVNENINENWLFKAQNPTWIQGESSFKNTPIKQVIKALENQYNITFDASKINLNKRFTGSFTHENLQIALQTVFVPLNISYILNKKTVILTDKK